ncbi:hypothetical protein ACFQO9_19885 [Chryseobacterium zhengzhouense]|uniref:Uncharacterized protein n=1 Tax=Chryseobacterium zhengzhouense TaxID=1636086 RepID=A0ABW2M528_9FLAO
MMKTLIKIAFLISFFYGIKANAQIDALQYLKTNFEIQKTEYIGKPFSYLLSKMTQIQPKTNWSSQGKDLGKTYSTNFIFCDKEYSFYNAVTLHIVWQEIIPTQQIRYYEKKNGFYFTNEERNFYGDKIIKDIAVFR